MGKCTQGLREMEWGKMDRHKENEKERVLSTLWSVIQNGERMRGCERVRKINRLRWKTEKEIKSVALASKNVKADPLKILLRHSFPKFPKQCPFKAVDAPAKLAKVILIHK